MSTNDPIPVEPEPTHELVDATEAPALPEPLPVQISCWRCGLLTIEAIRCVHCTAILQKEAALALQKQDKRGNPRLFTLIVAYVLIVTSSIVYSLVLHGSKHVTQDDAEHGLIYLEVFDLVITLSLFAFLGRRIVRRPSLRTRVLTWCLAPPAAVGMYFLTHWYMEVLRHYFSAEWMHSGSQMEMTWKDVLMVAVQPAIVEELFFRYFAYGTLRQVTNVHSAVFLSALMFALAHLYNPLGLPFLLCMGILLGYARAYSGGLLLPMLLHFGHNFTVLYMESMK